MSQMDTGEIRNTLMMIMIRFDNDHIYQVYVNGHWWLSDKASSIKPAPICADQMIGCGDPNLIDPWSSLIINKNNIRFMKIIKFNQIS